MRSTAPFRSASYALRVIDIVGLSVDHVITRCDYELQGVDPGNRVIKPQHVRNIKEGLRKHAHKFLTGTFTLAVDPDGVAIQPIADVAEGISIVKFSVISGYPLFILDAQHRDQAVRELWDDTIAAVRQGEMEAEEVARMLKKSSIPVLIVLESDRDEISRMFVTMAKTQPISPSLIAVMDREQFANRVGLEAALKLKLLASAERLAYQSSTATGETLYAAAAIRGAAASIFIGFRDRTPEMREANLRKYFESEGMDPEDHATVEAAADEVVDYLDYAYKRIPGWHELQKGDIDPKQFRANYVHGTPSGLYVVAGVICAARMSAGVDPKHVIDLMAKHVRWGREDRTEVEGSRFLEHPDFESTLVVNEPLLDEEGQIAGYKARTAGGARTNYEKATRNLIERLIKLDPDLADMQSDEVQIAMGLKASDKRGRPAKEA